MGFLMFGLMRTGHPFLEPEKQGVHSYNVKASAGRNARELQPRRPVTAKRAENEGLEGHARPSQKYREDSGPLEQLRASEFAPLCKGQSNFQVCSRIKPWILDTSLTEVSLPLKFGPGKKRIVVSTENRARVSSVTS